jgi:NAD(P)-dependent dehydrogenase (short-subunit alcohol dehydrogenase family)
MRLTGKVALIRGGARGMGACEARLFAREGARVVIGDILEAEGRAVEADIRAKGGEALFVRLDVTDEADWGRAVARTLERFHRLDVLVNNAGVSAISRIEDTTVTTKGSAVCAHGRGYHRQRLEAAVLTRFRAAMTPPMVATLTEFVNSQVGPPSASGVEGWRT